MVDTDHLLTYCTYPLVLFTGLLPIYFGSLGLCYVLVFGCMLLLQWRKGIQRERRAKAWVARMKTEWLFHCTLTRWTDKEVQPGMKTETCNPESNSMPKHGGSCLSSEAIIDSGTGSFPSLPEADPYKPVFQEVSCACALSHLPPLLEHSASYPCSNIPAKSTPFNSPLKFAMSKTQSYQGGSSISA